MGLPQGLYQTIQPRGNNNNPQQQQQPQGVGMMPFKYNTTPSPMMTTTGRSGALRPDAVPGSLQASSLLSQALLPQSTFSGQNFSLSSQVYILFFVLFSLIAFFFFLQAYYVADVIAAIANTTTNTTATHMVCLWSASRSATTGSSSQHVTQQSFRSGQLSVGDQQGHPVEFLVWAGHAKS